MNQTINGYDITLNYDPHILDFVAFDQLGLTFGGNVGCPVTFPQCALTLASSVDRVNGVIRLAQVLGQLRIGPNGDTGNLNSVTLFRLRFDVVGVGYTPLHFGTNVVTFAVGITTGSDPHFAIDGSFSTQAIFNALNGQVVIPCTLPCSSSSSFNASWSFSPNPEVPGSPLTFTATASCSYCTGSLTYNWDFRSVDSSTYVSKIDRTGSTVTVTAPPPIITRVTLNVTSGSLYASAARLLPLAVGGAPNTIPVKTVAGVTGSWLGGVPSYSGSYLFCPAQNPTDFSVCTKPTVTIPLGTQSQNKTVVLTYNFAGLYTSTLSITDSAPSQVGPFTAIGSFLINVTGTPPVFTVSLASNASRVDIGQTVMYTASVAYNPSYPVALSSSSFLYVFSFGDGTTQSISSSRSASLTHTYSSGGNFAVGVTAQETVHSSISKSNILENGFLQLGGNQTLSTDFTISPASPQTGQPLSFNALVFGGTPPYSFTWNFGDGATGSGNPVNHIFLRSGTYTIMLTVTDAKGAQTIANHSVFVNSIGGPIVGVWSNTCLSFNITSSKALCGNLTVGGQFVVQVNVTNAPSFNGFEFALYYDPHYVMALRADVTGATGTPTVFGSNAYALKNDVTIPGTVYLSVVGLGQAGLFSGGNGVLASIVFNITGNGVSPLTLAAGLIYPNGFAQDASGQRPDWTLLASTNSAGTSYEIGVGTADGYFTNVAGTGKLGPVAGFIFNPSTPAQGQRVTFDASLSLDPDNRTGRGIRLYLWDFGDGGSEVTNRTSTFHDYVSPGDTRFLGNFTVRLTVIDIDNGFEGMAAKRLEIIVPPFHDMEVLGLTATPSTWDPRVHMPVNVMVTVKNAGTVTENYDLSVTFGPPTTSLANVVGESLAPSLTKSYQFSIDPSTLSPGIYTVVANVIDLLDNNTSNNSLQVTFLIAGPPDFQLTAVLQPFGSTINAGQTTYAGVSIYSSGPTIFYGTVTLSGQVSPAVPNGPSLSFNPTQLSFGSPGPSFSTLTIATSASTPPGNYTIIITGTSGILVHKAIITVTVTPPAIITLNPSSGSLGTLVTVHGSNFQNMLGVSSSAEIEMTFDNQLIGLFFFQGSSFNFIFDVPHAQPGVHFVHAIELFPSSLDVQVSFLVLPEPGSLSASVGVGSIYFPGDTAVIYAMTSVNGQPTTVTNLQLMIILPDGSNLTLNGVRFAEGIYKATYAIPARASFGTYAVVVKTHLTGLGDGSALATFEVKPTWLQANGRGILTATGIAGVVGVLGLAAVSWKRGYLVRRKGDLRPP
jgi:hypothetical protein